jgi:hypothetical protein
LLPALAGWRVDVDPVEFVRIPAVSVRNGRFVTRTPRWRSRAANTGSGRDEPR